MKIDWAYMRKGWASCVKAWKVFDGSKIEVEQEVNAKKETIDTEGAKALLQKADKVVVASCKKILEFDPKADDLEEMLKKATGRTGNLRAPTLRVGDTYYVGFSQEMYQTFGK